jgi:hypothetical protein
MSRYLWVLIALAPGLAGASPGEPSRMEVRMDPTEARAVLDILAAETPDDTAWRRLLTSEPYRRLKKREAAMGRDFGDDAFRRFVLADDTRGKRDELQRTLLAWSHADLAAIGRRLSAYLPPEARVRATVYPVIKPQTNSFVFETTTDPAIFLYLDPAMSAAEFENTVAHELHHVGLASLGARFDEEVVQKAAPEVRPVLTWIGAFGEGLAVLAAAGAADVHPLQAAKAADRIRWDQDMTGFASNLRLVEQFLLDVLRGAFRDEDAVNHVGMHFFGYRGPWYTVGYRMAALVEQRFGRPTLLECMKDPRELLWRYNEAVPPADPSTPRWSEELLGRLGRSPGNATKS